MNNWGFVLGFFLFLLSTYSHAQTFDTPASKEASEQISSSQPQAPSSVSQKKVQTPEKNSPSKDDSNTIQDIQKAFFATSSGTEVKQPYDPFALMNRKSTETTETPKEKAKDTLPPPEEDDDFFVPEDEISERLNTPTVDGSDRGGSAFVAVDDKGNMKKVTNIFLFYDNFKINHSFGNYTTCDVRFNIVSNLDRKLSNFDVKLVWPGMTTTLSFSNLNSYTRTYYNYTLLGEGCYSMDKVPNIVVNRCRAKGMTSAECAKKIKWLSK